MIIELGKMTTLTRGGGMIYREHSGIHCLITKTDNPAEAC
jgi:hypothetical protein